METACCEFKYDAKTAGCEEMSETRGMDGPAPLIAVKDVRKSFGDVSVLDGVSVRVMKHETVSILGPSGCGKSTLMNIVTGLISADSGEVCVSGRIGYMQQKDLLLPWKTVMDNVNLPRVIGGDDKREAAADALPYFETFGLSGYEQRYPHELSGGMRQRVNFLRTFLTSGDIMLLDEPFGALDSITRGRLGQWLTDVKKHIDVTIMLITHDVEEAVLLSDRVYVLSDKPSVVRAEIAIDFCRGRKEERRLSPELMDYKRQILSKL
jgi:ABC-type nitrate/sulfonate/bicarbonate transport system ATPase subunit